MRSRLCATWPARAGSVSERELAEPLWPKCGYLQAPFPRPAGGARKLGFFQGETLASVAAFDSLYGIDLVFALSTYLGNDALTVKTTADLSPPPYRSLPPRPP